MTSAQIAEFKRQDGVLVAGMGALMILAASAGVIFYLFAARQYDLKTFGLVGVESGRGQDDTLSAISVSPDDICDGVFRDAGVAGDPSV